MKQNGYRTLRLGMKRYVNKFDNLNDVADHQRIQLRDNAEGDLDIKVKLIGTNTGAEEIRNLEIADRETEDIRITFNQVVKDLKLGQKRQSMGGSPT